ncbi:BadF/BadG/BcrA/BcrD ATPase family protein [Streptomyces sp. 549]|uniref:N-acetylglucosamine kinase n=1 Tax=Streptomyces sp. 549 TaxID=3049076 RepID=UPI0024C46AD5|nr:BadF/BadG/BcrA/BcrD ATPase family protein [Streptomyces sp. 549]MDK1474690.1 BadF/BadG/BcrA/BcrD ATPase family protein [Streptomyces sp. 549]
MSGWVLGADSGGSGLRIALGAADDGSGVAPRPVGEVLRSGPVRTGPEGIDAAHLLEQLVPAAHRLIDAAGGGRLEAVCLGAAGMATLGSGLREALPPALEASFGVRRLALAADAVTAYAGALGERPGVVVAAGTGMIAVGTDLRCWRRADGWGHLLGDCGGGAWIGRAGLEAALRAADGRSGGSAALLARVEAVFGPVCEVPSLLYPRADRAAALAAFAPEVARCAADDDPVAARILDGAAAEIADTAAAVHPAGPAASAGHAPGAGAVSAAGGGAIALTGGLFKVGDPLLSRLHRHLSARLPDAPLTPSLGDPLAGALLVAGRLARGTLRLPSDPRLLHLLHRR